MPDKIFFDTNCLIYLMSENELEKKIKMQSCIVSVKERLISTQVLNEMANVLTRKFSKGGEETLQILKHLVRQFSLQIISEQTVYSALQLHERYQYSYFDCLMLASALESECSVIYSEDMQHKQMIEKKVQILNPFNA